MKKEKLKQLENIRKDLIQYNFDTIDDNDKIKQFFDKYLFFCTFEIDWYEKIGDFEYIQFDCSAQNTGNIFKYRYNTKTKEYVLTEKPLLFSAKVDNFDIPKNILDEIFNIARENEILIKAEKELTKRLIKEKSI